MIAMKLVDMIERQAEEISKGLLEDIQSNRYTEAYHRFSSEEVYRRAFDVYRNLGDWLQNKTDEAVREKYIRLGKARFHENIPVSQVVYALLLTRIHLLDYIKRYGLIDTTLELYQEQELSHMVVRFFDKAVFFSVFGYEQARFG